MSTPYEYEVDRGQGSTSCCTSHLPVTHLRRIGDKKETTKHCIRLLCIREVPCFIYCPEADYPD